MNAMKMFEGASLRGVSKRSSGSWLPLLLASFALSYSLLGGSNTAQAQTPVVISRSITTPFTGNEAISGQSSSIRIFLRPDTSATLVDLERGVSYLGYWRQERSREISVYFTRTGLLTRYTGFAVQATPDRVEFRGKARRSIRQRDGTTGPMQEWDFTLFAG